MARQELAFPKRQHPEMSPSDEARQLIKDGYYQVSRAYQILARLPEGETGKAALAEAAHRDHYDAKGWAERMPERDAADQFLRVYAREEGLWVMVTDDVFDEFRKQGGGPR